MLIADDQPCDDGFAELIRHAALAGALSYWSRREPAAASGLARIANRERAAATALLSEILDGRFPNQAEAAVRVSRVPGENAPDTN